MKKLLYILCITSLIVSCSDYLDEEPKSEITEVFASTPDGINKLVLSLYETNRTIADRLIYMGEGGTDLWTHAKNGENSFTKPAGYQDDNMMNSGTNKNFWKALYNSVNVSNFAEATIDQVSGISDDEKAAYHAEVKGLRSFYYWMLAEAYGDGAHFTLTHTSQVVTEGNQAGLPVIYKQIFDDINSAVAGLPATSSDFGRLNQGVAKALKMRYLLSLANQPDAVLSAVGLSKSECYTQTSQLADQVIGDYGYQLYNDFEELFKVENNINNEIIWSVQFTDDPIYNGSNYMHRYWVPKYNESAFDNGKIEELPSHSIWLGREYRRIMPTYFFTQLFHKSDKRRLATFQTVWPKLESHWESAPTDSIVLIRSLEPVTDDNLVSELRDKSTAESHFGEIEKYYKDLKPIGGQTSYVPYRRVFLEGINHVYDITTGMPTDRGNYHTLKKFLDPTRLTAKQGTSHQDVYFIRLAEIYLMKAEAEFRSGNNDVAAAQLNILRQRAEIPGKEADLHVADSDITLNFILDEYARELAGESFRWFVLKRSGILVDRIKNTNPDYAPHIESHNTVRPVPQSELDDVTNPDEFVQNSGYLPE